MTKIFALLFVIVFAIGFFRALLTLEWVRKVVNGRLRLVSYPFVVSLGAVAVLFVFVRPALHWLSLGGTMTFLIASPMINEVAVVVLAAAVGWKVAALYVQPG